MRSFVKIVGKNSKAPRVWLAIVGIATSACGGAPFTASASDLATLEPDAGPIGTTGGTAGTVTASGGSSATNIGGRTATGGDNATGGASLAPYGIPPGCPCDFDAGGSDCSSGECKINGFAYCTEGGNPATLPLGAPCQCVLGKWQVTICGTAQCRQDTTGKWRCLNP